MHYNQSRSGHIATAAREAIISHRVTALLTHLCFFSPFFLDPGTLEYLNFDRQKALKVLGFGSWAF